MNAHLFIISHITTKSFDISAVAAVNIPRFNVHTFPKRRTRQSAQTLSIPEGRHEQIEMLERLHYGMLAKEYMKRFITDTHKTIDHTYGPRMVNDTIVIDDGAFEFENNALYIKSTRCIGTQGL